MKHKHGFELKDIAGYLPWGLKCLTKHKRVSYFGVMFDGEKGHRNDGDIPILRPLSDLCKTITHNGRKVIPIVMLAKTVYESDNWRLHHSGKCAVSNGNHMTFSFYHGGFHVYGEKEKCPFAVHDQTKLFDYLHELKIDYRDLIPQGLAVSTGDVREAVYA